MPNRSTTNERYILLGRLTIVLVDKMMVVEKNESTLEQFWGFLSVNRSNANGENAGRSERENFRIFEFHDVFGIVRFQRKEASKRKKIGGETSPGNSHEGFGDEREREPNGFVMEKDENPSAVYTRDRNEEV